MPNGKAYGWAVCCAAAVTVLALMCPGCKGGPGSRGPDMNAEEAFLPLPRRLPLRDLGTLKKIVMRDARLMRTLTAECTAVIASPYIPFRIPTVQATGRLALRKPKHIYLHLDRKGKTVVKLVGDGKRYRVAMPLFDIPTSEGQYGDPIFPRRDELHFMPDDLADALDLDDVFAGKWQAMRTTAEFEPSLTLWQIDSLRLRTDRPEAPLRLFNSLMIDRRQQRVRQLSKYDEDGNLRVRFTFVQTQIVPAGQDAQVAVPSFIRIWYPVDNTLIDLRLSCIKVNVKVDERLFE